MTAARHHGAAREYRDVIAGLDAAADAAEPLLGPAGTEALRRVLRSGPETGVHTLGWWRSPHPVRVVDVAEVAAVERVPLSRLVDPEHRVTVRHPSGWVGPAFDTGSLLVWGFTAGVLDALLRLGGWERPWDRARTRALDPAVLALAGHVPADPPAGPAAP